MSFKRSSIEEVNVLVDRDVFVFITGSTHHIQEDRIYELKTMHYTTSIVVPFCEKTLQSSAIFSQTGLIFESDRNGNTVCTRKGI
mmetsp:Transcript_6023/g.6720  ORF Transcript_6023/g.6720 Transcript_6023/m.6720 type:complete len:85 (+) Transcript_6023:281-535(+)